VRKYGYLDGLACTWNEHEAWLCGDNRKWQRITVSEASRHAALMTEAEYHETFGKLPAMPKAAFQTNG